MSRVSVDSGSNCWTKKGLGRGSFDGVVRGTRMKLGDLRGEEERRGEKEVI
jgi:hypothetical protein